MTRACPVYANAPSPRTVKYSSHGERVVRVASEIVLFTMLPVFLAGSHKTLSGGVGKSYRPSSPAKSLKTYVKARSTAQCLKILKKLLPNARHQKMPSEVGNSRH